MEDMETNVENKFESMIYQTEIERVKFVLKSYLRVRLFKVRGFL
jgi:GINS complex subunit 4